MLVTWSPGCSPAFPRRSTRVNAADFGDAFINADAVGQERHQKTRKITFMITPAVIIARRCGTLLVW